MTATVFVGLQARIVQGVQQLARRKYLLGVVLAWGLILGLTAGSSNPLTPGHRAGRAAPALRGQSGGPNSLFGVTPSSAAVPSFSPPVFTAPDFGGFGAAPPAPVTPTLTCPYPIPQAQSTPFSPGEFLAFESPLIDLSGPFAAYNVPTLGAIAPLVPFAAPLVSIAEPVMNAVTPNMAQAIYDFVAIEQKAGLDNPTFDKYVAQFEPSWLQLMSQFTPYEQALASSTAGQCTVLFENELSTVAAQLKLPIPQPPLLVPNTTGSSSTTANANAAATAVRSSSTTPPIAQLALPWSGGVPAGLPALVKQLAADKVPVEVVLADLPPAGQQIGGQGFADFVAEAVHALPSASIFEIDGPGVSPAAPAAVADLVHGLAAADFTRQPGQLIGPGVPAAALGPGAPGFWSPFAAMAKGYQRSFVDFVAANLTPGASASLSAATAQAFANGRALEHEWSTVGGVPAEVPLFAAVDLVGSNLSASAARQELAAFHGALAALHVGVLGLATGP